MKPSDTPTLSIRTNCNAPLVAEVRRLSFPLFLALSLVVGCNKQPSGDDSAKTHSKLKFGYVLHGLNDFTQIIKQGAEDAARAEGVIVDVLGPAGFTATADAIAMFEGLAQKRVNGLI